MTKEDVIEILERFVIGAKPCSQREIVDACASAYRMLKEQPSLPANLGEAAEKYAHSLGYDEDKDKAEIAGAKEDFVAGAEWNTGQFEKNRLDALRKVKALRDAQNMHAKTLTYGYRCLAIRLGKEVDEMLDKLKIK